MLRYENAQVYMLGEVHRKVEYQQFRNALFKYLVEKKGVRVLLMEHGYASGFLEMKRYRTGCPLPTNTDTISLSYPKRTMSCIHGLPTGTAAGMRRKNFNHRDRHYR